MSRASRLICATAAAALAAILGSPASAASVFAVQTDNWYIGSLTNSCIAFNRLPKEYNHSPYNSLTIHAPKDGGYLIEVMFWPGPIKHGERYSLALRVEGRGSYEIDADGVYDIGVKSRGPIPDKLVKDLQTERMLTVGTSNIPVSLGFDTTRMDDVFTHLDDCRRMIAKQ